MITLDSVLHPNTHDSPAQYITGIIDRSKLPDYIIDVRSCKRNVLLVDIRNQLGGRTKGFIHITTSQEQYQRKRGMRRSARAILLVFNQHQHHVIDDIVKICREIHSQVPTQRPFKKKGKKRNRINFYEED